MMPMVNIFMILLSIIFNVANGDFEVLMRRRNFLVGRTNTKFALISATTRENCECTNAQKKILTDCFSQFFSKFGITMTNEKFPPYRTTSKIIANAGPCNAFNELITCDAGIQAECICQDSFTEMASTFSDGLLYLTDYIDMMNNCTEKGQKATKCDQDIQNSDDWMTITNCVKTADNQTNVSCSHASIFMSCVKQSVEKVCGANGFEAYCYMEVLPMRVFQSISADCYKGLLKICNNKAATGHSFNLFITSITLLLIGKYVVS